jgi:quercetin dioxygenase-like cupin family protein
MYHATANSGKETEMKIKTFEEVPNNPVDMEGVENVKMRLLLSQNDGADHFVMRMFEIAPGGHTPLHAHDWEHEIYVLEGQGVITLEGQEYSLTPGHVLLVPVGKEHQFKCTDPKLFRFLCIVPATAQG